MGNYFEENDVLYDALTADLKEFKEKFNDSDDLDGIIEELEGARRKAVVERHKRNIITTIAFTSGDPSIKELRKELFAVVMLKYGSKIEDEVNEYKRLMPRECLYDHDFLVDFDDETDSSFKIKIMDHVDYVKSIFREVFKFRKHLNKGRK